MVKKPPATLAQLKLETAVKPHQSQTDLKKMDKRIGFVHLISGTTAKNEDFYAYISVRPSQYEEFVTRAASGNPMDIDAYGEVLEKGFGKEPSEETKEYMTRKYGIDHEFMKHLGEEVEKLQKEKTKEAGT